MPDENPPQTRWDLLQRHTDSRSRPPRRSPLRFIPVALCVLIGGAHFFSLAYQWWPLSDIVSDSQQTEYADELVMSVLFRALIALLWLVAAFVWWKGRWWEALLLSVILFVGQNLPNLLF